jgi:hypothetical protein
MELARYQKPIRITSIGLLILAVIALVAEILPEVQAKLVVIPALVLAIILSVIQIKNK